MWNSFPQFNETASWTGHRDNDGYAIGYGTVTWFKSERSIVTGSNIPAPTKSSIVVGRYSGRMVRGKFQGQVARIDPNGRVFHSAFVNGSKTSNWIEGAPGSANQESIQPAPKIAGKTEPVPPAAGPPVEENHPEKNLAVNAGKPGVDGTLQAVMTPPSSLRAPMLAAMAPIPAPSAQPSPAAPAVEPTVRNRIIEDFREETQSVFSRVDEATGDFHELGGLDSVQELPTPVSESIDSLIERARDSREKLGYETALRESRAETQTADALAIVDQATHILAAGDAAKAASRVSDFLKRNPEAPAENQKPLWHYLVSLSSLCSRSENGAGVHLQQADLFVAAGKMGDALREYQEAYRLFPTPATAEKIRHLRENSLGL